VKIDNSAYNVRRTSIISFYKHKIRSDSKEITQDQSVLGPLIVQGWGMVLVF
jgi:hypothetical protein